jgi:transcription elongation factor Elf1
MFSCRACNKDHFQVTEMKKEKWLMARNRGICKSCSTAYENTRQLLKKAEENPSKYLTCDDCDRIFSLYTPGARRVETTVRTDRRTEGWQLRVDCPFCKSEEISRY